MRVLKNTNINTKYMPIQSRVNQLVLSQAQQSGSINTGNKDDIGERPD